MKNMNSTYRKDFHEKNLLDFEKKSKSQFFYDEFQ
jgi:hypothetical protein